MQGVEWQAHSPVEPFLDQVVDHLEIARVKDDAGRIAMAKQHLHLADEGGGHGARDRKSTRLNSSHSQISYAVFCLKKKKKKYTQQISRSQYATQQLSADRY